MFKPSNFQSAILQALTTSNQNILIDAKAGAGKTSTLKLIAAQQPTGKAVLCLAFNNHIVQELKEKLPKNIEVATTHSVGFEIIRKSFPTATLERFKYKDLVNCYLKELCLPSHEITEFYGNIAKMVDLGRMGLATTTEQLLAIAQHHNLTGYDHQQAKWTLTIIERGYKMKTKIDFADMIYFVARGGSDFVGKKYELLLIDECQDWNLAQQAMIKTLLTDTGRFVAVGDPNQAIYGFAGADAESFQAFSNFSNTITLPLNECYRCAPEIINHVNKKFPDIAITAFAGNKAGEVRTTANYEELSVGDLVLCRNTAPLMQLCLILIRLGKPANVRGKDISASLNNLIRDSKAYTLVELKNWFADTYLPKIEKGLKKQYPQLSGEEITELEEYTNEIDKISAMMALAEDDAVRNCRDLVALIAKIFVVDDNQSTANTILLSTVHKAKGLEADRCFIICQYLMPAKQAKEEWQKLQEKNLEYVAYTRGKNVLAFVTNFSPKTVFSPRKAVVPANLADKKAGDYVQVTCTLEKHVGKAKFFKTANGFSLVCQGKTDFSKYKVAGTDNQYMFKAEIKAVQGGDFWLGRISKY